MSKPTIQDYVQAAYLHGLSTENLDTGELEPPRDISEVDWITEAIEARMSKLLIEAREIYIPVRGFEGLYEVSNFGNIRSISRGRNTGRQLKPSTRVREYQCVSLSKDNVRKVFNVHRLVAEAWISNPEGKRTVNHKDSNPRNNHIDNLEWATYSENERHARANGKVMWNKGRLGFRANVPRIKSLKGSLEDKGNA